uniref:Uncharacterized protein n=1 Tax=Kalanchoe fedtschenkoi TaxID=63787 RepID=A0A7N0VD45_KALFE
MQRKRITSEVESESVGGWIVDADCFNLLSICGRRWSLGHGQLSRRYGSSVVHCSFMDFMIWVWRILLKRIRFDNFGSFPSLMELIGVSVHFKGLLLNKNEGPKFDSPLNHQATHQMTSSPLQKVNNAMLQCGMSDSE